MISGTSWTSDEVYGYGEYRDKVLPSFVTSANLNMQSCFNSLHLSVDLGMSLYAPVNGHCTAITVLCQGSLRANRHAMKRLMFKSPRRSTTNEGY